MTHPAHMPTPADDRGAETQIEKLFRSFVDSVNGFPHGHESLVRLAIQHAVEATAKDKADLVKALEEIERGLRDTHSTPGQWMTRITKPHAHKIAFDALARLKGGAS